MDANANDDTGGNSVGADGVESVTVEFQQPSGSGDGDGNGEQPVKRGRGRPPGKTGGSFGGKAKEKQPVESPRTLKFDAEPEPATPKKRTPSGRKSAAAEMEVAAGMITATVFAGIAAFRGEHWLLKPNELAQIAPPLSHVLASLPGKQAKKAQKIVNDLSAPIALVMAVMAAAKPRLATDAQAGNAKRLIKKQEEVRKNDELSKQPPGPTSGVSPAPAGTGAGGSISSTNIPYPADVPGSRVFGL